MKIVRRFVLSPGLARLIARDRGVERQIVEGYFSSRSGKNQFVRLEADRCHLVLPQLGPEGEVMEDLAPLPPDHAKALFDLSIGQISYDQLHLPIQGNACQRAVLHRLDHPSGCDLVTVEFDSPPQAAAFEVALWFGPEVSSEGSYERRSIALNGVPSASEMPLSDLQLEQVLDLLEQAGSVQSNTAAHDIPGAPVRSPEASTVMKAADATIAASRVGQTAEPLPEPAERLAHPA